MGDESMPTFYILLCNHSVRLTAAAPVDGFELQDERDVLAHNLFTNVFCLVVYIPASKMVVNEQWHTLKGIKLVTPSSRLLIQPQSSVF